MAMTAPGMGFLSGTVSRRKSFRESQAQRLRSERRSRFPDQVEDRLRENTGAGSSGY
jgi:hypothetical protein